ncbi:hypothetical protein TNIN_494841 [Trichonephila inaurata madagascariensis]|uniref:Uncharacterized protein n=1 Tax=Trichonephila inaurata madagascariensis TaxID=2747483 RepID=A0A8X7CMI3_9ARAC|nr:hypothetical protein TNIN_494841 [Trichonephila inaurata madagascariensis]
MSSSLVPVSTKIEDILLILIRQHRYRDNPSTLYTHTYQSALHCHHRHVSPDSFGKLDLMFQHVGHSSLTIPDINDFTVFTSFMINTAVVGTSTSTSPSSENR